MFVQWALFPLRSRYSLWTIAFVLYGTAMSPTLCAQDGGAPFSHSVIDASPPDRPYTKMVGDIDGDGDPDILVAGADGPLLWYSNPDWERTEIATGGWNGVNGEVVDIDGDGDVDVVLGGVVLVRNPLVGGGRWTTERIARQRAHDVEVADLLGNGRIDIVARDQSAFGQSGDRIYVYYQDEPTVWRNQEFPCPHGEGLKLSDLDLDGDPDIIIGGRWYENERGNMECEWTEHAFAPRWTEPDVKVETADLNGDRRPDIVMTPAELRGESYKVAWYEAPADPRNSDWREHVVIDSIECVIHSLSVGDLDNDGDADLAIAEMHQGADPDEVSVLWNGGHGHSWRKQVLSQRGSHEIVIVDLDRDGDLDILGANHAGDHPLDLWTNESTKRRTR